MNHSYPPIIQVGNVLVSPDVFTQKFCCDLEVCHGACCIEGDAGAPVTIEEIASIEENVDAVWNELSASAQSVIDQQGVAYIDREGDMVTSIVGRKDCVFTCYQEGCCLCVLERAYRKGEIDFCKPISCALYPIREKALGNGLVGLNYHCWKICQCAVEKGKELGLLLYQFLKEPLIRRFGQQWYDELCMVAQQLSCQDFL